MHEDTPPRVPEIVDDEGEILILDNDIPLDYDDDELNETEDYIQHMFADEDDYSDDRRTPVEDISELSFSHHSGPVYGCTLHPEHDLAVTGAEDDKAFVWNTKTGIVQQEFDNHKDTVTEVHFSHDGYYLAMGDMAGELEVLRFNESGPGMQVVWEYSMGDMSWMRWHRSAHVLFAGSDSGEVYVWRIPSGDCKILPGGGVKCEAGELSGDGKKLFVSYTNGALKLWDIKQCSVIMQVVEPHPLAHSEMVTTVACHKEAQLYMSGGQDERTVFCSSTGVVGSVRTEGPVECVGFSPSSDVQMAATGTLHGQIAIWDPYKCTLRTICEHPEIDDGITKMKWLNDFVLAVGTVQGNIYGYDARSGIRMFSLTGHMGIIYEMQYDARNNILLSVSDDQFAKIFRVPELGD